MMKRALLFLWLAAPAYGFSLPDSVSQATFIYGTLEPSEKLYYRGQQVPVAESGTFLLAVGRDAQELTLTLKDGWFSKKTLTVPVQQRVWPVDRIEGMASEKVTPPAALKKRLRREQKLLDAARAQRPLKEGVFPFCFVKPVEETRISAPFGAQRMINGVAQRPHSGLDMAAPEGTPVKATADGVVILSEEDMFYTGGTVLIEHGSGVQSGYSHLSRRTVQTGETVKAGDVIGAVGSTGRSTGPHLHFTLAWNNIRIDPQSILSARCP